MRPVLQLRLVKRPTSLISSDQLCQLSHFIRPVCHAMRLGPRVHRNQEGQTGEWNHETQSWWTVCLHYEGATVLGKEHTNARNPRSPKDLHPKRIKIKLRLSQLLCTTSEGRGSGGGVESGPKSAESSARAGGNYVVRRHQCTQRHLGPVCAAGPQGRRCGGAARGEGTGDPQRWKCNKI